MKMHFPLLMNGYLLGKRLINWRLQGKKRFGPYCGKTKIMLPYIFIKKWFFNNLMLRMFHVFKVIFERKCIFFHTFVKVILQQENKFFSFRLYLTASTLILWIDFIKLKLIKLIEILSNQIEKYKKDYVGWIYKAFTTTIKIN